jgi:uncharacterized Tic20 family protein
LPVGKQIPLLLQFCGHTIVSEKAMERLNYTLSVVVFGVIDYVITMLTMLHYIIGTCQRTCLDIPLQPINLPIMSEDGGGSVYPNVTCM